MERRTWDVHKNKIGNFFSDDLEWFLVLKILVAKTCDFRSFFVVVAIQKLFDSIAFVFRNFWSEKLFVP